MTELIICGVGGHARVAFDIAILNGFKPAGFLQITFSKFEFHDKFRKVNSEVLSIEELSHYENLSIHIALGDNEKRSLAKEILINRFQERVNFPNLIHPKAFISRNVDLGDGNLFAANSFIGVGSAIGNFNIINTGSTLDHDNSVGNFTSIAPNVVTGGQVFIDDWAKLGIGAKISNNIRIGKKATVSAMSFVNQDVYDGQTVFGVPAKVR